MRMYSAVPTMDEEGRHIGGMAGFMKSLGLIVRSFKPSRVIIVFDGKGGSQRRRKLFGEYKANRKPYTRLNRTYDMTTEQQEQENMKFQLVSLLEMLECLPVTIIALDNIEADDTIAYCSELVAKRGGTSIIYSTDKDFLQMVSDNTKVYNPVKKKTFTPEIVLETFGVHPNNFLFYKSLLGDKSDNIGGIRGAGGKTVIKYIPELADPDAQVSLQLIEQKYASVKKKPKLIETILAKSAVIERNMKLMDLHDVDISVEAKLKILHKFEAKCPPLDKVALTKHMIRTKIIVSIQNHNEWITSSFSGLARFHGRS
jgi:5'-3' exonuclease